MRHTFCFSHPDGVKTYDVQTVTSGDEVILAFCTPLPHDENRPLITSSLRSTLRMSDATNVKFLPLERACRELAIRDDAACVRAVPTTDIEEGRAAPGRNDGVRTQVGSDVKEVRGFFINGQVVQSAWPPSPDAPLISDEEFRTNEPIRRPGGDHWSKGVFTDGSTYTGEWSSDSSDLRPHGRGRRDFPNGDSFKGHWHHGTMHGPGSYAFAANKSWVSGVWEHGLYQMPPTKSLTAGSEAVLLNLVRTPDLNGWRATLDRLHEASDAGDHRWEVVIRAPDGSFKKLKVRPENLLPLCSRRTGFFRTTRLSDDTAAWTAYGPSEWMDDERVDEREQRAPVIKTIEAEDTEHDEYDNIPVAEDVLSDGEDAAHADKAKRARVGESAPSSAPSNEPKVARSNIDGVGANDVGAARAATREDDIGPPRPVSGGDANRAVSSALRFFVHTDAKPDPDGNLLPAAKTMFDVYQRMTGAGTTESERATAAKQLARLKAMNDANADVMAQYKELMMGEETISAGIVEAKVMQRHAARSEGYVLSANIKKAWWSSLARAVAAALHVGSFSESNPVIYSFYGHARGCNAAALLFKEVFEWLVEAHSKKAPGNNRDNWVLGYANGFEAGAKAAAETAQAKANPETAMVVKQNETLKTQALKDANVTLYRSASSSAGDFGSASYRSGFSSGRAHGQAAASNRKALK